MQELIRSEMRDGGVLLATIDMPGRTMNVFSEDLIDALQALLERAERDPQVRAVVVTSGKPSFIAGADLAMVRGMTERARTGSHDEMFQYCGRLGRLFLRIERSAKPWVAAVNGLAMGGGLELALACRRRLVADAPGTQLGVPEVKLGLLPGAGGTQRLPRLVGPALGFDLLLSGRSVDPGTAVAAGMFDEAKAPDALLPRAIDRARQEAEIPYSEEAKFGQGRPQLPADSEDAVIEIAAANGLTPAALSDYPAYRAIVRAVLQGAGQSLGEACDTEMTRFLDLMFDPVAGNMITALFLNRQRLERLARQASVPSAIAHGPLSDRAATWATSLARARLPVASDPALGADVLVLSGAAQDTLRLRVADLSSAAAIVAVDPDDARMPLAVLSGPGPHGRVVELAGIAPGSPGADLAAGLAKAIRAIAYWTPGGTSALAALRAVGAPDAQSRGPSANGPGADDGEEGGGPVDSTAFARMGERAAALAAAGVVTDPELLDSAAVLAGLMPAYTGGPLTYRAQHGGGAGR